MRPGERNRYVEIPEPSWDYFLEVGQLAASGHYYPFAKSKKIFASLLGGRGIPSNADSRWKTPEGLLNYYRGLDIPGVASGGISSAESQRRRNEAYAASRLK